MRRLALSCLSLALPILLAGCTGIGVFFDHTFQFWGANPNAPAGSSETFLRLRGQHVDVPPILPETGNVWPANTGPDMTLQDIERQQNDQIRRAGGQPNAGPTNGPNPAVNRANQADQGLPPPAPVPAAPGSRSTLRTPQGPAVDVGGGTGRGYRDLQNNPSGAANSGNGAGGILVPNGNGTSTLIKPDGSISTVPTK